MLAVIGLGCAEPRGEAADTDAAAAQERLIAEARLAADQLGDEVKALGLRYADAAGSRADEWDAAQRSIVKARRRVEADLAQAAASGSEASEGARVDIVEGLQTFTERVDRARLSAVQGGRDFVTASESELTAIDGRIDSLRLQVARLHDEAREERGPEIETLRATSRQIAESLATLSSASEEEIVQAREDLTRSIAALSGAVQRRRLEIVSAGA